MKLKPALKYLSAIMLLLIVVGIIWLTQNVFPAISGYGSKNLCSSFYLQHRNPEDVIREELGGFPLSLGRFVINEIDSSATGSVFGIARRKTIYREGCGCTLINDFSEEEIRRQQFVFPVKPAADTGSIWPYGDKLSDLVYPNVDKDKLESAVEKTMRETSKNGRPSYTRAVVVLFDGHIVAERYAPGFDKNTVMLGWSVSKSLVGAMTGILVKENRISVDAPAPIAAWAGSSKKNITVKHLLQQTSGLDFTEIYSRPSSVTKMLFSKGDMAAYAASLPLKHEPGTEFNYSGGNSNILSRIIRQTVGEKDYTAFPYKELFYRINAYSFLLEPDASGTYIGSSYSYATARDFARFGLLYFYNGKWNGEQILPPDWVRESTSPSRADKLKHYGYQFWLNGLNAGNNSKRSFPAVPADMYYADGYGGQDIYIIPSEKLVVVRLGVNTIDANKFLKEVIASIKK